METCFHEIRLKPCCIRAHVIARITYEHVRKNNICNICFSDQYFKPKHRASRRLLQKKSWAAFAVSMTETSAIFFVMQNRRHNVKRPASIPLRRRCPNTTESSNLEGIHAFLNAKTLFCDISCLKVRTGSECGLRMCKKNL
jgi:hypothetical protein